MYQCVGWGPFVSWCPVSGSVCLPFVYPSVTTFCLVAKSSCWLLYIVSFSLLNIASKHQHSFFLLIQKNSESHRNYIFYVKITCDQNAIRGAVGISSFANCDCKGLQFYISKPSDLHFILVRTSVPRGA